MDEIALEPDVIIPGAHRIELATGGLGFAALDARRPDIGPVRPGYLLIPGASTLVPSPPIFDSVVAADGYLTVDVHSPSAVDGYEIGVSADYTPPAAWWSTASGHLVQPLATGTYYLWARASYQGAYSSWSLYGQLSPGQEEWRLTWADEALNGPTDAAYPYTACEFGAPMLYNGPDKAKIYGYHFWLNNAPSLNALPTTGGKHGTRVDFTLQWSSFPSEDIGIAICFDPAAMTADHTTATYYALALNRGESSQNICTLRLYSCVGTAKTMVAESANVFSHITVTIPGGAWTYTIALSMFARDNVFTIEKSDGTVLFTATDTTYPWTSERVGVALWQYTEISYYNTHYYDYIRVYSRDHTGEAETVTPGSPAHNDLGGRSAADCHPASAVTNTPAGNIAATTVQAAINELDSEKAPTVHTHDDRYYTETELSTSGSASVHWDNVTGEPATYPPSSHTHGGGDITSQVGDAHTVDGIHAAGFVQPATTQTVNFTSSMTAAQIQALIDAVPRCLPPGVTVTFQFADGTYTLAAALTFSGFFGGGTVNIYGNTTETDATALHTSQAVHLDFSGASVNGIFVRGCELELIAIRNLKVTVAAAEVHAVYVYYSNNINLYYNYLCGSGTGNSRGANFVTSTGYAYRNYVSAVTYGLACDLQAVVTSRENDDTGTAPQVGLYCNSSTMHVYSTQPSGSSADRSTSVGGKIWDDSTVWTSSNDGSGSGLDADTLDGTHLSGVCLWAGALASAPTGAEGKIYYNTGDSKVYIYANAGWKALT